jgi:hypothetical protein
VLARQYHSREHVVDALRHRDDVGLDNLRTEPLLYLADRGEHAERAPRGVTQRRIHTGQRTPSGQLVPQHVEPLVPRQRAVVDLADAPVQLRQHFVVRIRVLAYVQSGQLEAERGDGADRRRESAGRGERAAVARERTADQLQVGDQLAGAVVVPPGDMRRPRRQPGSRVGELEPDAA